MITKYFKVNDNSKRVVIQDVKGNRILTSNGFIPLIKSCDLISIKQGEFRHLINEFYSLRENKKEWKFKGDEFKILDNFTIQDFKEIELPIHIVKDHQMNVVSHRNKLYYINVKLKEQFYPTIQIIDFYTLKYTKWVNVKNLAPIFNKSTKSFL